jgi:hypothetical protein
MTVLLAASPRLETHQEPTLQLPLRLTTWAVSMGTIATGRNAVIDINITRWSTTQEREALVKAFAEGGQNGLLRALERTKAVGRFRIPGWTGPDPQGFVLGWDLHYAWQTPGEDGGHRLFIATNRQISFAEARNQPRTIDYPFTLIEIRLDKNGEGVGKAAVATKIGVDKKKNVLELENYSSEPVRLQNVKINR